MNETATYPGCEICAVLPTIPSNMKLIEDAYWLANLRQEQLLLGRSYITLKRHAAELDALTSAEEASFLIIRNALLQAIRTSFRPLTFNVSCLKNNAFRDNPNSTPSTAAHVHWHIIPRYSERPVSFAGKVFTDPRPGRYLLPTEHQEASTETATAIAQKIRDNLSKSHTASY